MLAYVQGVCDKGEPVYTRDPSNELMCCVM